MRTAYAPQSTTYTKTEVDTALSGKVSDVIAGSGISVTATNGTRTITALNAPHSVKSNAVTYAAGAFDTLELTSTSGSLANNTLTLTLPDPALKADALTTYTKQETQQLIVDGTHSLTYINAAGNEVYPAPHPNKLRIKGATTTWDSVNEILEVDCSTIIDSLTAASFTTTGSLTAGNLVVTGNAGHVQMRNDAVSVANRIER